VRIAVSPRLASVEPDDEVTAGFERAVEACRELGATLIEPAAPECGFEVAGAFRDVMTTDMVAYHRRFDDHRGSYRRALREWVEVGEQRALSGERYASLQAERQGITAAWTDWLGEHGITAVIEPTIPIVAPQRGDGYEHAGTDEAMISLTHFWNWTGFPVVAMPSGVGQATGLPVSVSLIGAGGTDEQLLDLGVQLQAELGLPDWP
jgi:Asp-tRNA(Asn)/Glu-tRNA(Gln) amidotransferase A subunit family amidase